MRVVFDAYWWIEGPLSNAGVQREFIRTWLGQFAEDDAILVVPRQHVSSVRAQVPDRARVVGTRLRPHGAAMAAALPAIARRVAADVIVCHNFAPLSGPSVIFVHDVLFQSNPEWFTRAERAYFSGIPLLARRSAAVATSTAHEAARIRAQNPKLKRVEAVGLGLSRDLTEAEPQRPEGLPDVTEFVLTVGRLNVRKNLDVSLTAAALSTAISADRPLIVVGEPDGKVAQLSRPAARAAEAGAIVFLPRVDYSALAWLYRHAALFLFLSLDEGYGLPPVEAAHFGCPVLVSDIGVFHETLGDYATYVGSRDVPAVVDRVDAILAHPWHRSSYVPPPVSAAGDWVSPTSKLRALAQEVGRVAR